MKKLLIATLATCSIASAFASQGIRYINYDKNKIPNIITAAGIATQIVLEEDEKIKYSTFGFEGAWNSQVVGDHILVFKSKDAQPQTNLLIHTNKRDYIFTVTVGNNTWTKHPKNSGANYAIRMRYSDKKSLKNRRKNEAKGILRNRDIATASTYLYSNYDYRATEDAGDITPVRMWDNGKVTFVEFRDGAKRGVAYELNEYDEAFLVNQHTEKNGLLVLHGVYRLLIIRLGDQAVEIRRNEQYGQTENQQKTNVDKTVRTIDQSAPAKFKQASAKEKLSLTGAE